MRNNTTLNPEQALQQWREASQQVQSLQQPYACQTITPLYGGGVKAGEVDKAMPIRASAIRGHLRFWWRLLNDRGKPSQQLFAEEVEIWGGIRATMPVASRVAVSVTLDSKANVQPAFVYERKEGKYKGMPKAAPGINHYALFPAQGTLKAGQAQIDKMPHEVADAGIKFTLTLRFEANLTPSQQQQVLQAVRWWASFGGVGARTRRGLGAIQVDGLVPVTAAEIESHGGKLVLRKSSMSAMQCWNDAVNRLQQFRQGVNIGRNPPSVDPNRPGRSRWSEPDALRTLTRRYLSNHAPEHLAGELFPRAAFGLPIVFHFKDEKDPQECNLEPTGDGVERLASPLILCPYWNGKEYQPAALLLPGWERVLTQKLKLRDRTELLTTWPSDKTQWPVKSALIPPMKARGSDPLTAFMRFFAENTEN